MDEYFVTSDTFEAAVLMTLGFDVDHTNSTKPRIEFFFKRTPEFDQTLESYMSKQSCVEPFTLKSNMDYLFRMIYALRPR